MSSSPRPSLGLRLLPWLIGAYLRLCWVTMRWTWVNREAAERVWASRRPVVFALWHNRIMLGPVGWGISEGAIPIRALISKSKDGEYITRTMTHMDVGAIRGSTAKGGKQKGALAALREMLRTLKEGATVAITPDGPRGPRMRAQMGAVQVARMAGAPILCFAWSCSPGKNFRSWDRLLMPFPFAKGYGVWSDPFEVPRQVPEEEMEAWRLRMEEELNRITAQADQMAGRAPIAADAADAPVLEDAEDEDAPAPHSGAPA